MQKTFLAPGSRRTEVHPSLGLSL